MSSNINITYIGSDNQFLEKIDKFVNSIAVFECNLMSIEYKRGEVFQSLKENTTHLFIVDILTGNLNEQMISEISRLKKLDAFRSTVFCCALDKRDQGTFNLLLSSGFSLGYLKGTDERMFLVDAFFLASGTFLKLPSFATARNMKTKNEVSIGASISNFSKSSLSLETDIVYDQVSFSMNLPMFGSERLQSIEPVAVHEYSGRFNHLYLSECEYKFIGPWDNATEDSIHEDDLINWIELSKDSLKLLEENVCVFSRSVEFYTELFNINSKDYIEIRDGINGDEDLELLKYLGTKLVLIDLDEEDITLEKSMALIKEASYLEDREIIFIIFNCKSTSEALRKLTQHKNVLASKYNLNVEMFKVFTEKFISTRKTEEDIEYYCFNSLDAKRVADIYFEIEVTSLSEHEICFKSNFEIPYYTVMHSELPISFYFTIIPETKQLAPQEGMFHYQAIIHTVYELDFEALRRVVNKLITDPVDIFTPELVERLKGELDEEAKVSKLDEGAEEENQKETLGNLSPEFKIDRTKLNKKSKL